MVALTDSTIQVETSASTDTLPAGMDKINLGNTWLDSTSSGYGASLVGVDSGIAGGDVQAALELLDTDIGTRATTSSLAAAGGADSIGIAATIGSAATVEEALVVLDAASSGVPEGTSILSTGVTDGYVLTASGSDTSVWEASVGGEVPAGAQDDVTSAAFTATGYTRTTVPTLPTQRVHATADCWIAYGDSTVSVDGSSGMAFASGTEILKAPSSATHVAVRGMTSIGALNLTGLTNSLSYELTTTVELAYSAATAYITLPVGAYIRIYAPTDCYFLFGDNTVTASTTTATFFEAGTETLKVPTSATHLAMVQYSIASSAYITGMN
jgi:hypothetical protein